MIRCRVLYPWELRTLRRMVSDPFELHDLAALGVARFSDMMRERGALGFAAPGADRQRLHWALRDLQGSLSGRAVHGDVAWFAERLAAAMLRAEAARLKLARWMPEGGVPVEVTPPAGRGSTAKRVQPGPAGTVVVLRPGLDRLPVPDADDDGPPAA